MQDLIQIDRTILEFLGGRPTVNDCNIYEFEINLNSSFDTTTKKTYLNAKDICYYCNWIALMDVLNFIEGLGYSSIIKDHFCEIVPKSSGIPLVTHCESRDTKQWAVYHCIYNFILKYNEFKKRAS